MKISCFIPSFNKPEYVINAIESVVSQSFEDWELWILENSNDDGKTREKILLYLCSINRQDKIIKYEEIDFTDEERKAKYPTALLLNEYYKKANGDIILYLSDDDIFYPNCFIEVAGYFDARPEMSALYFSQNTMRENADGVFTQTNKITADRARGLHTVENLDCQVDGGQVAHKKHCLDQIEEPYFNYEYPHASHCDGLFLEKLGKKFTIEALQRDLGEHRVTRKSTWTT